MARPQQLFEENDWYRNVGLCDSHLDLKLIDDAVGDRDNLFKHIDLFLVPDHNSLSISEEEVNRVASMVIKMNLYSNFLKQDEVAFQDELHLNTINHHGFLFVFGLLIFFHAEVVELLEELLVLLKISLEFINRFLCNFVELISSLAYRSHSFSNQVLFLFLLFWSLELSRSLHLHFFSFFFVFLVCFY